MAFNSKGDLYSVDLGDGEVYKIVLDNDKNLRSVQLVAKVEGDIGVDGITFDSNDTMYIAGFAKNSVLKMTPDGTISTLADYDDNTGDDGALDQPADLIVFDDKLVISNFDLMTRNVENTAHDKPYTLSFINLSD